MPRIFSLILGAQGFLVWLRTLLCCSWDTFGLMYETDQRIITLLSRVSSTMPLQSGVCVMRSAWDNFDFAVMTPFRRNHGKNLARVVGIKFWIIVSEKLFCFVVHWRCWMLSVPCGQMDIVTRVRFWMRWCTLAALSLEVQIARVGRLHFFD